MLNCPSCAGKPIPREYRKTVEALFPENCACGNAAGGNAAGAEPAGKGAPSSAAPETAVLAFADSLGVGADYRKLDAAWNDPPELEKFLHSFQNNLYLVIQKTWVEKADEDRKEKLLDEIPGLMTLIKEGNYAKALETFGAILEELAWLLFGSQSRKEDFFEYVFRIDHQVGLFWWYAGQLGRFIASGPPPEKTLQSMLFLGLCYLTDF
jgi:hypothetical protein